MFYKLTLSAEESAYARVEMTDAEAQIVARVLNEMSDNLQGGGWCGSCSIDLNTPSLTRRPTKAICTCNDCGTVWETDNPDGDCNYCPNEKCGNANYSLKISE